MDAISKLLGHDVQTPSASPALAEIVSRRSRAFRRSNSGSKASGPSANDLGKSSINPVSRRKKSEA